MDMVKAILYELQPFRIVDVENLLSWMYHTSVTLIHESVQLKQTLSSMKLPSPRTCGIMSIWMAIYVICIHFRVGTLWFMFSAFVSIILNLGERKKGEASAYSVFNEGFQSILGTMTAEQFEKEIRHDNNFGDDTGGDDMDDDDMIDYAAMVNDDDDSNNLAGGRERRPTKQGNTKKKGKKNRKLQEEAKRNSSSGN
jgi:hypothetical protein